MCQSVQISISMRPLKKGLQFGIFELKLTKKQREPNTAKFCHKLGHCMHDFHIISKLISVYFCQKAHYSYEILYTVANEQARRRL